MRDRTFVRVICALALAVVLSAGAWGEPRHTVITILHTNDLHGQVTPVNGAGGLARAATLTRRIRSEMPNVLLLDAGDMMHGTPVEYFSEGRAIIDAMNAAGYDAAAVGNHDFDWGLPALSAAIGSARFPFLSANVTAAGGGQWDGIVPYKVFTFDGVRVAVLGLTTTETLGYQWPDSIKDIAISDPEAAAAELVGRLRQEADVVIVLSHLGLGRDLALAKSVSGIDLIIGGHSHSVLNERRSVGNTLVAQAGFYALYLGRIDLMVKSDESGSVIESINGRDGDWNDLENPPLDKRYPTSPLLRLVGSIAEDPAVTQSYLPHQAETEARLAEVIGEASGDIHCDAPGYAETAAGNLVADAVRELGSADVALVDAGSVVRKLRAGPITVGAVFEMIRGYSRQQIVRARIAGAQLLLSLQSRMMSRTPIGLQFSGMTLRYDRFDPKMPVADVRIGGEPLDPLRFYSVAAQAYVMMDLMKAAGSVRLLDDLKTTTREAVVAYVRAHSPVAPPPTGRILPR